ncbi:hypothetical protein OOU_Y34scaffold00528g68 [Pyricularia oryzae Y34]|uniref:Uncharacterized protein n=1 Tax=Pyricularia oryzae (strain Y34) TaxID=1143189 RepID=A0AA97PL65_PYRO3|nr:hypothetical protein OOU_Y34scaffold00528g68 [Pyricularia oryzae Y34]
MPVFVVIPCRHGIVWFPPFFGCGVPLHTKNWRWEGRVLAAFWGRGSSLGLAVDVGLWGPKIPRKRRTPGWSRRGIVIAIRQIRPFQHHGHLSAVLCSAAGGDYISRQAQSSADLPKRIETAQHGGTPEEHRRDHSLEAL